MSGDNDRNGWPSHVVAILDRIDKTKAELSADISALKERVAVVETNVCHVRKNVDGLNCVGHATALSEIEASLKTKASHGDVSSARNWSKIAAIIGTVLLAVALAVLRVYSERPNGKEVGGAGEVSGSRNAPLVSPARS